MSGRGAYDEPRTCRAGRRPPAKEEAMHPEFIERMLTERVNDLRREAAAARLATLARRSRHARLADARRVVADRQALAGQAATDQALADHAGAGRAGARREVAPGQAPAE